MNNSKKQNHKPARDPQPATPILAEELTGGVKSVHTISPSDLHSPDELIDLAYESGRKTEESPCQQEKGASILTFNEGDIVINVLPKTRVTYESSGFYGLGGSTRREEPDNYFCRPFLLVGVRNNIIYLREMGKTGAGRLVNASLHSMENGWKLFDLPPGVTMEEACSIPQS